MDDAVAGGDIADIGEIVHGLADQVAVAEDRPLGPARWCPRCRTARPDRRDRSRPWAPGSPSVRAAHSPPPVGTIRSRVPISSSSPATAAAFSGSVKRDPRAAILQDEGEFLAVQLGVDRHGTDPGMPAGVFDDHVVGYVRHDDRRPVAGLQAEPPGHPPGQHRGLPGERAVGRDARTALAERRRVRVQQGGAVEEGGEVHGARYYPPRAAEGKTGARCRLRAGGRGRVLQRRSATALRGIRPCGT